MAADDDRQLAAADFDRARQETVRYHEEFYATASLGQAGTWLARPHPLVSDALALVPAGHQAVAYDLGAGVGRHTIPMMQHLPKGSTVVAVDLLTSALRTLEESTLQSSGTTALRTRAADLNDFQFETPADLVFAFSAIEHLPNTESIHRLLTRIRNALKPSGVVAIGIVADRHEIDPNGHRRTALLESSITAEQTRVLLAEAFSDLNVVYERSNPTHVKEQRGTQTYTLASTLVTWLGTKPR